MSARRHVPVGMALLALITLGTSPAFAELKVTISGYVKLDLEYQDKVNTAGSSRTFPAPNTTVFDTGPGKDSARSRNGEFLMDVRETRFRFRATDKVGDVTLRGLIEVDFAAPVDTSSLVTNSSTPRLRHAMGEGEMRLGPGTFTLLAGQWWSAFSHNPSLFPPSTVDFSSNIRLFARQPQLKLTYGIPFGKDTLNLIGAVQAQSVSFLRSPGLSGIDATKEEGQDVPAFVGKLQWLGPLVRAEIAGIFSRAKGIAPGGQDEAESVYGLQGTVIVSISQLSLYGHADSLNGINREANGALPDAVFKGVDRGVATINSLGFWGGVSYKLTPTTSLNGLYEHRSADSSGHSGFGRGAAARTDLARQQVFHVNVIQQFWDSFQFGIEYERQWVDAFRNNHGSRNTYHAGFWYFF